MVRKGTVFRTTFHSYQVEDSLGSGGSGTVYKVVDEDENVHALKCLDPNQVTNRQRLKRFENELHFCSCKVHQNVITVYDHGLATIGSQRCPFYVMRFYASSLRRLLEQGLAISKALGYFLQILDGVEASHMKSVWHRDLKPENILYDPVADLLVVADFGIAHFAEEQLQTLVRTKTDERLANFQYAAPEQRREGEQVDQRADIYALGLILNEMFTKKVYQGSGCRTIASVAPEYAYLDQVVDHMVRQSPAERPESIDLIKQLLSAKAKEHVTRQKLGELTQTVIPRSQIDDPLSERPVELIDVEYVDGKLVFQLSQKVTAEWVSYFRNYRAYGANIGFAANEDPSRFVFAGNIATLRVPSERARQGAQEITNRFKDYLQKTYAVYRYQTLKHQRQREEEENNQRRAKIHELETRDWVRKSVKI